MADDATIDQDTAAAVAEQAVQQTADEADDAAEADAEVAFNEDDDAGGATKAAQDDDADTDTGEGTEQEPKPEAEAEPAPEATPAKPAEQAVQAEPEAQRVAVVFDFDAAVSKVMAEKLGKIKVGANEVDVTQFVADFPEVTAVSATLARRIVEEAMAPIMQALPAVRAIQQQQQHESFMDAVSSKVDGAREVQRSAEFQAWVRQQPKQLQEMASVYDVDAAVFVLQQYRVANPGKAAPKAAPRVVPASPAFDRKRAVLAGTVGAKASTRAPAKPNANDYDAAFDEED